MIKVKLICKEITPVEPRIIVNINSHIDLEEVYILVFFPNLFYKCSKVKKEDFGKKVYWELYEYVDIIAQLDYLIVAVVDKNANEFLKCNMSIKKNLNRCTYNKKGKKKQTF